MRRNPIYVFKDVTSTGIYDVPVESMIQIIDSDGAGTPLFMQLVKKENLSALSTIEDFLKESINFINLDRDTTPAASLEDIGLQDSSLIGNKFDVFSKILNAMPDNSTLRMAYDGTTNPNLGAALMYGGGIFEAQVTSGTFPNRTNTLINTSSQGNGQAFAQIDNNGIFVNWSWNMKSDDIPVGATGEFKSSDQKNIIVVNGIITEINLITA